jgi:undecaprenyl-diphosphatase
VSQSRIALRPFGAWPFWAGAWLALLAATIALTALAAGHDRLPGDLSIMEWAQGQPTPGETVSDINRAVTTTEAVIATGAVVAVLLWLGGRRREALLLALGLAVLPFLQSGVKELVDRPRPPADLVEHRAGFSSPSFPSGHVMSPTLLYGFLIALSLRERALPALRAAVLLWSLFAVVVAGPANVYLGVHWPSDVLGGYAWGLTLLLPLVLALLVAKGHPEPVEG